MSDEQHPLHALPRGHRLQEYELVRVLGFGGFGMTYLGFDHNLDKAVAIKEYLPSDIATRIADGSVAPQASDFRGDFQWGLERFLDEARTLARFDHRHIIKVYRFFEAHGTAYIVMEYAEGETLSAYLERKGTLTEAELKGILYPLLDGLEVVHGADFLHRDIKPGNIVLRDADGSPVLLDFGAARQAIGAKSRSVTSIVTPGYAPIEQYSSRGHQGAWTDIYALGGVCYRALTGQVPEDATDRVRQDPLVPVAERCAGQASREFLSAIDMALSVDEGDRPQNVAAWRAVLGADVAVAQERRQEETPRRDTGQAASENQRRERAKDLHTAAKQSDHQAALFLLRHGADSVNARDHNSNTPLHTAAKFNALDVARVLLNHGADVNAKNNDGWKPYSLAEEADMLDLLSRYERRQEEERQGTNLPPRLIDVLNSQQEHRQEKTPRRDTRQAVLEKQRQERVASENQRREQAVLDQQRQKQTEQERRQEEKERLRQEVKARRQVEAEEEVKEKMIGCGFMVIVGIVIFFVIRSC